MAKGSQFPLKNPTQWGYAQFATRPPPTKLLTLEYEEGLEIIGHSN